MAKRITYAAGAVALLGMTVVLSGSVGRLFNSPAVVSAQSSPARSAGDQSAGADGPADQGPRFPRQDGNAASGKNVFRFETFGNEGFWTDALRLPAGIKAAKVTPMQAMKLGLSVDVDALDAATVAELTKELKADPTGKSSMLLNDPKTTAKLINANAVIGMPIIDSNGDGVMDIDKGDKAGASCALCHSIADGSTFSMAHGGAIGHRMDGLTNHNINIGKIIATGTNSRAWYPLLQLTLKANGGKTFGRAPLGLTDQSTEAEVDAYLSNPKYYPVGMFDDTPDANGDPLRITPLFRQDLAAPYGSGGTIARLDNFSNLVFTALFDPTTLTTPGGRALLHKLAGPAGDEVADSYVKVLKETGVTGYPYLKATPMPPATEDAFVGLRVDNAKLLDMNAYEVSLQAPAGVKIDAKVAAHGRELFRSRGCTSCHNVDQSKPVPSFLIPMKTIFPGDNPTVLAQREPPLNPVEDTPGNYFDDKMAVLNASFRGDIRGTALPLLLDLDREQFFLHDNSVASLDELLNSKRGPNAPHPFYLSNPKDRTDMVKFLKSLDTTPTQ